MRFVLSTDESFYLAKTDGQIKVKTKATLFNNIKRSGGGPSGTQRVDKAFTRVTRKYTR